MKLDMNKSELSMLVVGMFHLQAELLNAIESANGPEKAYFETRLAECDTIINKIKASFKKADRKLR